MNNRRLLLIGTGLALLLVVGGAMSMAGSVGDGLNVSAVSQPVMRYGGPLERTLRIVPPLHRALWPMFVFLAPPN
jgi:hypothetical protein